MVSCKKLEPEDYFYPQDPYMNVVKTANFNVRVSRDEMESISETEKIFKNRAAENCFTLASRQILKLQPLIKGSSYPVPDPDIEFIGFKGHINPVKSHSCQELVQDFHCSLKVSPHFNFAGQIVGLEGERTIAARGNRIVLNVFGEYPAELPAYFVIGRRSSEHGVNLISIFGSGRITRILSKSSPHSDDRESGAALAFGIILEANHEVERNDLIFMTMMDVMALDTQKVTKTMSAFAAQD